MGMDLTILTAVALIHVPVLNIFIMCLKTHKRKLNEVTMNYLKGICMAKKKRQDQGSIGCE